MRFPIWYNCTIVYTVYHKNPASSTENVGLRRATDRGTIDFYLTVCYNDSIDLLPCVSKTALTQILTEGKYL